MYKSPEQGRQRSRGYRVRSLQFFISECKPSFSRLSSNLTTRLNVKHMNQCGSRDEFLISKANKL
jgi:hypothetical protein